MGVAAALSWRIADAAPRVEDDAGRQEADVTDQERQKAEELVSRLELSVGQIFPRDGGNAAAHHDHDSDAERTAQPARHRQTCTGGVPRPIDAVADA